MSKYSLIDTLVRGVLKIKWGTTTILGKPFRDTSSVMYYNPIEHLTFLGKQKIYYESDLQNKISEYISQGDLVFDIGANIGQYALLFSHFVGETGKVISLEPDCDNFAILSLNKYKNNCTNLILINQGLDSVEQEKTLYKDKLTGGRKSSFIEEFSSKNSEKQKISTITFSTLIEQFGTPNFVKMDIEGYEGKIISQLSDQIITKPITWFIEVREPSKEECFNRFKFTHNCYILDNILVENIESASRIPNFANLLFVPNFTQ
ncbi:FkbM family methyltransferase [Runella limosa]|uniref:FkbM family methyltransferase n=1 Tax=Runella limosa TaxID=370978 RepID=UPI0004216801|nr:FkbM family methyltransferase [Runella limosa]